MSLRDDVPPLTPGELEELLRELLREHKPAHRPDESKPIVKEPKR